MNKNTRAIRKSAAKSYNSGQATSEFIIPSTSLGQRKQVITIGKVKRKSVYAKVAAKRSKGGSNSEE